MKTFVPHKMCALSLNTQAKLDKQILRDKHDAILNAFVLDMKQMLIDKEFVALNKERSERKYYMPASASELNDLLYKIETALHSTSFDVNEYFNTCAMLVAQLSDKLIELVKTCEA
jgi:hypothetical protein